MTTNLIEAAERARDALEQIRDREGGWTYEIAQKAAAKLTAAIEAAKEVEPAIDSAWNRFNQALSYGSDAPYPGMAQAFENHFGQSWRDRDWRGETATWAASWKAAVDSYAEWEKMQLSWKEAVINELIVGHIYNSSHENNPRKAVQDAITWNCQAALDPLVSSDAQALIDRGATESRAEIEAQVREECAQICERIKDEYQESESRKYPELKSDAETGAFDCAAAIRASKPTAPNLEQGKVERDAARIDTPGEMDAAFEHWYRTKFKPAMERGPFDKYVARQAWFAAMLNDAKEGKG